MDRQIPDLDMQKEKYILSRADRYVYTSATESQNPELALTARRVHASSYRGEGFIHDEAIGKDGQVADDIDKSRGDNVEYYIGRDASGEAVSTLRVVDSTKLNGGFRALPGYGFCESSISNEAVSFLENAEADGRRIVEISSFGHIPEVSAGSGLELLRHAHQKAYGSGDVWYFSMVSRKLQALVHIFGPKAIRVVGEPVSMEDDRIGDVTLTPGIVDTTTFFDDIKDSILAEGSVARRNRYLSYLRMFTDGLDTETLNDEVKQLLEDRPREALASLAVRSGISATPVAWSQPQEFKLASSIERRQAERLIREGAVTNIRGPILEEESLLEGRPVPSDETGSWFYFPWSSSLIHYPEDSIYRKQRQSRDLGLVEASEHDALRSQRPLYAGLSVGSHVLEHMMYAGVGDSHVLADFDVISTSNLNRIHAGGPEIGEPKIDYFAKKVSELDPYVKQTLLREGVTRDSLGSLDSVPTIIFDEVDDLSAKVLLRQYAKENGVPLVMTTDVGYKSIVDVERHDLHGSKIFNGRLSQGAIEAMLRGELTDSERMKIITKIIGLSNASFRLLKAVSDPSMKSFPQLELTAAQGGVLTAATARDILLGRSVKSGRQVVDIRRSLRLPRETNLRDGLQILNTFLNKK